MCMARIIGLDYGKKRTGIAVTDPLQIIVQGLETVETSNLLDRLKEYLNSEEVVKLVIGYPRHKDQSPTYLAKDIDTFVENFRKLFPEIEVDFANEDFSSRDAKKILFESGVSKKKRQDKALLDKTSAVVILQRYLGHIS